MLWKRFVLPGYFKWNTVYLHYNCRLRFSWSFSNQVICPWKLCVVPLTLKITFSSGLFTVWFKNMLFFKSILTNICFRTYLKPIWLLHSNFINMTFYCASMKRSCEWWLSLHIRVPGYILFIKSHQLSHKNVLLHLANIKFKLKWNDILINFD